LSGTAHGEVVDVLGIMIWCLGGQLLKAFDAEITAAADDANALSRPERAKKLEQIDQAILTLEYEEALLVEEAGLEHRIDVDPRAWLQIEIIAPADRSEM
jgi:hypothetical protein